MARNIAIVVAIVVVAGAVYYMWPLQTAAPTTDTNTPTQTEQTRRPDMPGTWQSQSDAKFTREIRTDGVIIDRYEGNATAGVNGSWTAVVAADEEMLSSIASTLTGKTVIRVVWEGGVETTYFSINEITANSMSITDLSGRGGVTVFTRI